MFNIYNLIFQILIWKMIPTPISRIPTLIYHIPIILTVIPRIPIIPCIPFPNSPFRLFQIASFRYIFRNLNSLLIESWTQICEFHLNLNSHSNSLDYFYFNNLALYSA